MTKPALGNGSVVLDGVKYKTSTFEYDGERYTIRELSADEGDDIADASTGPGPEYKFNGRLNTRMLLAKALVEPVETIDAIGKFPGPKYLTILQAFNRMNSLPAGKDANPTPPAGSAEPTPPSGGEPSPTS